MSEFSPKGQAAPATVSAIIPACDAEAYVAEAIESVLEQTYEPVECIVVDDGSSDTTAAVIHSFGARVRLLQQENAGPAAARNSGAALAKGELLAFLDADDRWLPERLERGVAALGDHPDAAAVVCATQVVDELLRPLGVLVQERGLTTRDMLLCRAILVSTGSNLLIRRDAFETVGGFDERLYGSEDWALTFALVERGQLNTIDEPLVQYRVHAANLSSGAERLGRVMLQAYDQIYAEPGTRSEVRRLRRQAYANLHRMIAGAYFAEGRTADFAKHAALSVSTHPSTLAYFLATPLRRREGASRPRDPFAMSRAAGRRPG